MSDENEHNGSEGADLTDPQGDPADTVGLPDILGDVAGLSLTSGVKKNLWKAMGALIAGVVDWPVAWLEASAGKIRAEGKAREVVTRGAAQAAASRFGKDESLGDRAVNYFAARIVQDQRNRELVSKVAIEEVGKEDQAADPAEEIDDDWLRMFADTASNKTHRDMQQFLGKVLAGEIRRPGSFSLESVWRLSMFTQRQAKMYERLCNLSISLGGGSVVCVLTEPFGIGSGNALKPFGVPYHELLELEAMSLIKAPLTTSFDFQKIPETDSFDFANRQASIRSLPNKKSKLSSHQVIIFTQVGRELRACLSLWPNPDYLGGLQKWFGKMDCEMVYYLPGGEATKAPPEEPPTLDG